MGPDSGFNRLFCKRRSPGFNNPASPAPVKPAATPAARVNSVTVTGGSAGHRASNFHQPVGGTAQSGRHRPDPARSSIFPDSLPGKDLHNQAINRGEVKDIRVGVFAEHPPVTRGGSST